MSVWQISEQNTKKSATLALFTNEILKNLANGLKWLLWPLSGLYGMATAARNFLYNRKYLTIYESSIYALSVGNLTVGGTGKTPHIAYLLKKLNNKYQLATLSRGYGRQTRGFVAATAQSTAADIGDEPLQLFQHFGQQVPVLVCEKRAIGLQIIEKIYPKTQLVLLDDAFQHRAVLPSLSLLLTDYGRLFYEDFLLPTGRLREARAGAQRAQAVVVSKCPAHLDEAQQAHIRSLILKYTAAQTPVFFSTFQYGLPQPYFVQQPPWRNDAPCVVVSGIAQPVLFENAAKASFNVQHQMVFGDHHRFDATNLRHISSAAAGRVVLTTEKDFVKLKPLLAANSSNILFYYWPIEVAFLPTQNLNFDEWLFDKLRVVARLPLA